MFDKRRDKLNVYYAGRHTCSTKIRTQYNKMPLGTKKSVLKPILEKNPKATVKQISEEAAEKFLLLGNPEMARQCVQLATDKRLVAEMKEEAIQRTTSQDPNSFTAIAALRDKLKDFDPYLIYKMNDGTLNDEISYVFKSSTSAAQMALEMDCDDPNNKSCLKEEPVYIDAMHSRIEHYKSITAWVKNPITRAVMRLATMDAKNEDTATLTLFFRLLNEVLQKVSGVPDYKFNPSRFYVDEAGANINAIRKVFGRRAARKTVTCQWHFLRCARAKARCVKKRNRKTFKRLCRKLIKASTRSKYEARAAAIRRICADNDILDWFLWWDDRKFHIVPAYRGFNLSGLNLAEAGQSGMRPLTRRKLKLIDAAYKDSAQMMRQDESYRAYIGNISKEIGRGLNVRQIQERERRAQEERAANYAEALLTGDVNALTEDEGDGENFMPTDRARHRAPRVHSRRNPTQRKKPNPTGRRNRNIIRVEEESDASSIHTEENEEVPEFIDDEFVSSVRATKLVFINNTIKKCYGCGEVFNHKKMVEPRNLIFSRKTKRLRPDGKGGQVKNRNATNAFFCCRDMACLELEFPNVRVSRYLHGEHDIPKYYCPA